MEKILVPIDSIEWDNTLRSVEYAIDLVAGCEPDEEPALILLHVLHSATGIPEDLREKEKKLEKKRIKSEFESIKEICEKRGIRKVKTILEEKNPQEDDEMDKYIVRAALENDVDLIVLGSGRIHDRSIGGRIKKFVYGSVTEKVLHEAPCSVMVVRE